MRQGRGLLNLVGPGGQHARRRNRRQHRHTRRHGHGMAAAMAGAHQGMQQAVAIRVVAGRCRAGLIVRVVGRGMQIRPMGGKAKRLVLRYTIAGGR